MSNTYEKWNKREPENQITWRDVLGTLATIAFILIAIALILSY
jgi:hypothetical protein